VNLAPLDQLIVTVNTVLGDALNGFLDGAYALWDQFF
jgi:hypothetical protein